MTLAGMTPEPMWLLLGEDEPRQLGDELYMAQWSRDVWTPWAPDLNKPISHLLARRRIEDPCEPLRAELREAFGIIEGLYELADEHGYVWGNKAIPAWLA